MQQVERGRLDLESSILIHCLDFGKPHYQYNGFRFGQLGAVLEKSGGLPFYQLLMEQIVKPLNISSTASGNSPDHYLVYTQQNKDMLPYFDTALCQQMQGQASKHAGGAIKNQKVDKLTTLPAGAHKLPCQPDAGHAYNNWDSAPPIIFFGASFHLG
jgi:hypothetical protein